MLPLPDVIVEHASLPLGPVPRDLPNFLVEVLRNFYLDANVGFSETLLFAGVIVGAITGFDGFLVLDFFFGVKIAAMSGERKTTRVRGNDELECSGGPKMTHFSDHLT